VVSHMCGRIQLNAADAHGLVAELVPQPIPGVFELPEQHNPNNIGPGRMLPVIVYQPPPVPPPQNAKQVLFARWGLIRHSDPPTKQPNHFLMFNARADNLTNIHAGLLKKNRCVVPVSGFFEWKKPTAASNASSKEKQPYYVTSAGGLYFAGIYDTWTDHHGNVVPTFAIVTVHPAENLEWLHDRSPLILSKAGAKEWLDPANDFAHVKHLMVPMQSGLTWWPVTRAIGKLSYQSADSTKPIDLLRGTKPISAYFFSSSSPGGSDDANKAKEGSPPPSTATLKRPAVTPPRSTNKKASIRDYLSPASAD
jgi:putative SOS response-associated peptidase YedK